MSSLAGARQIIATLVLSYYGLDLKAFDAWVAGPNCDVDLRVTLGEYREKAIEAAVSENELACDGWALLLHTVQDINEHLVPLARTGLKLKLRRPTGKKVAASNQRRAKLPPAEALRDVIAAKMAATGCTFAAAKDRIAREVGVTRAAVDKRLRIP